MRQILFILLLTMTSESVSYYIPSSPLWFDSPSGGLREDQDVIDQWSVGVWRGDTTSPGTSHYKAVLFFSKQSLDRYLSSREVKDSILIDVKNGKQFNVKQIEIKKTVNEPKEVVVGYKVELKESQ